MQLTCKEYNKRLQMGFMPPTEQSAHGNFERADHAKRLYRKAKKKASKWNCSVDSAMWRILVNKHKQYLIDHVEEGGRVSHGPHVGFLISYDNQAHHTEVLVDGYLMFGTPLLPPDNAPKPIGTTLRVPWHEVAARLSPGLSFKQVCLSQMRYCSRTAVCSKDGVSAAKYNYWQHKSQNWKQFWFEHSNRKENP